MSQFKDIVKARFLRQVETKIEKIIWEKLRNNNLGIKFRRQHPVGDFVVDFFAPSIKLAVELDGNQHGTKDGKEYDEMRTQFLESKGITVIRFWNSEIENDLENVLNKIKNFPLSSNLERGKG